MLILLALSYIGGTVGFILVTLSIASGLYYVSEFVEEHARFSKLVIERLILLVVAFILLLMLVDGLSPVLGVLTLLAHGIYWRNLKDFPVIHMQSVWFIGAICSVLATHFLWFREFGRLQRESALLAQSAYGRPGGSSSGYGYGSTGQQVPGQVTFGQVSSFFGICVWLVPFSLFVSLSAGENTLPLSTPSRASSPSLGGIDAADGKLAGTQRGGGRQRAGGLVKQVYKRCGEVLQPVLQSLGITKEEDEYTRRTGHFA
ncbi:transmembrane adaptor Erv26 [Protomyces lactucae-debilis]|uniref:Transmembrane adaptor Erv26 n=1 Tax=Protomyces lactucae-debilis TaxID=2754530 RepID=A0A1Y2FF25_PROLT|nr:transmembrane adaptor Erv26 [Protomyces lactucae-debilis]ORY82533.1 transmembrane adaptor Erv26 [Protomyces lactucae-debilis]